MTDLMLGVLGVLLLLALQLQLAAGQDYCQLASCPGSSHTACKFKPGSGPAEKCSKDANGLTDADRDSILSLHNKLRQELADGKLDGFASATDMETLKWDKELETIAQVWADQCDYGHDQCRHVERFKVGQNIAMTGGSGGFTSELPKKVMMWWDEYKLYGYKDGTFVFNHDTGHFTQMAWAKTNLLGCGRSSYVDKGFTNEYLVCNYGPAGNVQGQKMYTAGGYRLTECIPLLLMAIVMLVVHNTQNSSGYKITQTK
ncbi:Venom allergen 3 [Frankliniella fusca]|uniref:Venom allergen 3 n=1 Tax=Frankliniella fusca TaxID=407009 RepID=A0AAE1LTD5_9NEOP|nr:Venom allergen 3 [Frankliniella fusca]